MFDSLMIRRDFCKIAGLGGIVLAVRPSLVLGEEKLKYTHVADMYPWDKVARTKEEIYAMPSVKNQSWEIEPNKWKEVFFKNERIKKLFKDSKKMESVILQLTDSNLNNDELGRIRITKFGIEHRILTPDNIFAPRQSASERDIKKYGTIFYYVALVNTKEEDSKYIIQLFE
jgi:hypothetical protein